MEDPIQGAESLNNSDVAAGGEEQANEEARGSDQTPLAERRIRRISITPARTIDTLPGDIEHRN